MFNPNYIYYPQHRFMMEPPAPHIFPWLGLIFWILVIFFVASLFSAHKNDQVETENEDTETDTAIQILRERYAKGEISKTEFLKLKKDLS